MLPHPHPDNKIRPINNVDHVHFFLVNSLHKKNPTEFLAIKVAALYELYHAWNFPPIII